MMKKMYVYHAGFFAVVLTALFLLPLFLVSEVRAADVSGPSSSQPSFTLPAPQKSGGAGVFDALAGRASGTRSNFPNGDISAQELSTILWAASGLNRPEKGWTVPMAAGKEPYCKVYVLGKDGVFLYDWKGHALNTVSKGDARLAVSGQEFVAGAPYVLLFVADGKALDAAGGQRAAGWGLVLTGAMTQDVYLAAGSLGIGARYMASMKEDPVRDALKLDATDTPICIMPLGKK
jgi:hypothetical protein